MYSCIDYVCDVHVCGGREDAYVDVLTFERRSDGVYFSIIIFFGICRHTSLRTKIRRQRYFGFRFSDDVLRCYQYSSIWRQQLWRLLLQLLLCTIVHKRVTLLIQPMNESIGVDVGSNPKIEQLH